MKRTWIIAAVVLGAGYFVFRPAAKPEPAGPPPRIVKAERGEVRLVVSATGEVKPFLAVEVKSKASGRVIEFPAWEGDRLEKDAVFVRLDPVDEQRNVARAKSALAFADARARLIRLEYTSTLAKVESDLTAAAADRDQQEKTYRRMRELTARPTGNDLVSAAEIESAELAFRKSSEQATRALAEAEFIRGKRDAEEAQFQAEVEKARRDLEDAELRVRETDIAAPISGILLKKTVQPGQIVSSGMSSVSGGTAIGILADLSRLLVEANVDESDIGRVVEGQPVDISVDAYMGKVYPGKVLRILPQGELDNNVIVFKVRVEVGEEGVKWLRPGMTANVDILVEKKADVLRVPSEALRQEGEGNWWLPAPGPGEKKIPVKPGLDDGVHTEILSGLSEGQEFQMPSGKPLKPGGGSGGGGRR